MYEEPSIDISACGLYGSTETNVAQQRDTYLKVRPAPALKFTQSFSWTRLRLTWSDRKIGGWNIRHKAVLLLA